MSTYLRFNIHGVLGVTVALYTLALGLLVLLQDSRAHLNRRFFMATATTALWTFSFGMMSLVVHLTDAYLWLSASYLAVPFISFSMYLFTSALINKTESWVTLFVGIFSGSFACAITLIAPERVYFFVEHTWGRYPVFHFNPAIQILAYSLVVIFSTYAVMAVINLVSGFKNAASPADRKRAGTILAAFGLSYLGSVDWAAALGFDIYPFGYLGLLVLVTLMTYAIVKHRAFDINVLVKRVVAVAIIYALLFAVSLPLASLFVNRLAGGNQSVTTAEILVLSCFFGVILSSGPAIYAFLVRHTFWLKYHESTGLVHELKSPLASIQSALEILEAPNVDLNSGNAKNYLRMIRSNSSRLSIFVDNLLQVAKAQEGNVRLNASPFQINELIQELVEIYRGAAEQKGMSLLFQLGEDKTIFGEREKIALVISNLLSNAVKFSTAGLVHISVMPGENVVTIQVKDQGKGLSASHRERIFERFFQADRGCKGAGMGLTIAKTWVEAHGGRIWAESEGEKKGTTVIFTLPHA